MKKTNKLVDLRSTAITVTDLQTKERDSRRAASQLGPQSVRMSQPNDAAKVHRYGIKVQREKTYLILNSMRI